MISGMLRTTKYSAIAKIESVFGKNLIVPTLKKGFDKQRVSLGGFGGLPFSMRLIHKILRKHESNLVSKEIETHFETIAHPFNHRKITTPSRIEKIYKFFLEQNEVDKIMSDVLNEEDSHDLLDMHSVSSKKFVFK